MENTHGIKVGDLFYDSWGYEQTNIDFYEVVGLKGKCTAIIRKVKNDYISGYGWSGKTRALPGQYVGQPYTVRTNMCSYDAKRPQCSSPARSSGKLNPTTADHEHDYTSYA